MGKELTTKTRAELNLTYSKFLLQYGLPFDLVSPLNAFNQQLSAQYTPEVLQQYTISRRTATKAIKTISNTLKTNVFQELRSSPFSLSLDASSDCYGSTYFAVCARLLEEDNYDKPQMKLVAVLPMRLYRANT